MNVVIDWGNTRIKAALVENNVLVEKHSFLQKHEVVDFLKSKPIENALISSVSGNPHELIEQIQLTGKIVELAASTPLPIKNKYATPNTLGVDRLAAACGAWGLFQNQASLVIDLGSCINYEFVSGNGNYLGGAISPGITMRFRAMNQFTANLPNVKPQSKPAWIGNNTESCLLSGVMNGVLSEIQGFVNYATKDNPSCNILICGGEASLLDGEIKSAKYIPELVLLGLNYILQYNLSNY